MPDADKVKFEEAKARLIGSLKELPRKPVKRASDRPAPARKTTKRNAA